MTLGEKIRTRRIELGMTMEDLGKKIGVQRSAINKYEKGIITDLKRSTIADLARALDVPPIYLLDDTPEDGDYYTTIEQLSNGSLIQVLHQNPRLGILFDKTSKMSEKDIELMIQLANSILKERDGDG